jgi:hypothetical protein
MMGEMDAIPISPSRTREFASAAFVADDGPDFDAMPTPSDSNVGIATGPVALSTSMRTIYNTDIDPVSQAIPLTPINRG